jgi:predicted NBD/HSP70 family sugar kinase
MAMPGPIDVEAMSFVGPTTLEGWKGISVQERLADSAGLPTFLEVDHAAAALGERLYGVGRNFRDFYYLYFGVGLGGCMVLDGMPLRGSYRNAGEIGHMPMIADGEPCPCGNRGCLERYLSMEAHVRRAAKIGTAGWIAEAVPFFRAAITTIENLFDPETIIIGGLADEALLQQLIDSAAPLANSVSHRQERRTPRVMRSAAGHDAALRGAAALAIAGVLSPRFGILFTQEEQSEPRDPMFRRGEAA